MADATTLNENNSNAQDNMTVSTAPCKYSTDGKMTILYDEKQCKSWAQKNLGLQGMLSEYYADIDECANEGYEGNKHIYGIACTFDDYDNETAFTIKCDDDKCLACVATSENKNGAFLRINFTLKDDFWRSTDKCDGEDEYCDDEWCGLPEGFEYLEVAILDEMDRILFQSVDPSDWANSNTPDPSPEPDYEITPEHFSNTVATFPIETLFNNQNQQAQSQNQSDSASGLITYTDTCSFSDDNQIQVTLNEPLCVEWAKLFSHWNGKEDDIAMELAESVDFYTDDQRVVNGIYVISANDDWWHSDYDADLRIECADEWCMTKLTTETEKGDTLVAEIKFKLKDEFWEEAFFEDDGTLEEPDYEAFCDACELGTEALLNIIWDKAASSTVKPANAIVSASKRRAREREELNDAVKEMDTIIRESIGKTPDKIVWLTRDINGDGNMKFEYERDLLREWQAHYFGFKDEHYDEHNRFLGAWRRMTPRQTSLDHGIFYLSASDSSMMCEVWYGANDKRWYLGISVLGIKTAMLSGDVGNLYEMGAKDEDYMLPFFDAAANIFMREAFSPDNYDDNGGNGSEPTPPTPDGVVDDETLLENYGHLLYGDSVPTAAEIPSQANSYIRSGFISIAVTKDGTGIIDFDPSVLALWRMRYNSHNGEEYSWLFTFFDERIDKLPDGTINRMTKELDSDDFTEKTTFALSVTENSFSVGAVVDNIPVAVFHGNSKGLLGGMHGGEREVNESINKMVQLLTMTMFGITLPSDANLGDYKQAKLMSHLLDDERCCGELTMTRDPNILPLWREKFQNCRDGFAVDMDEFYAKIAGNADGGECEIKPTSVTFTNEDKSAESILSVYGSGECVWYRVTMHGMFVAELEVLIGDDMFYVIENNPESFRDIFDDSMQLFAAELFKDDSEYETSVYDDDTLGGHLFNGGWETHGDPCAPKSEPEVDLPIPGFSDKADESANAPIVEKMDNDKAVSEKWAELYRENFGESDWEDIREKTWYAALVDYAMDGTFRASYIYDIGKHGEEVEVVSECDGEAIRTSFNWHSAVVCEYTLPITPELWDMDEYEMFQTFVGHSMDALHEELFGKGYETRWRVAPNDVEGSDEVPAYVIEAQNAQDNAKQQTEEDSCCGNCKCTITGSATENDENGKICSSNNADDNSDDDAEYNNKGVPAELAVRYPEYAKHSGIDIMDIADCLGVSFSHDGWTHWCMKNLDDFHDSAPAWAYEMAFPLMDVMSFGLLVDVMEHDRQCRETNDHIASNVANSIRLAWESYIPSDVRGAIYIDDQQATPEDAVRVLGTLPTLMRIAATTDVEQKVREAIAAYTIAAIGDSAHPHAFVFKTDEIPVNGRWYKLAHVSKFFDKIKYFAHAETLGKVDDMLENVIAKLNNSDYSDDTLSELQEIRVLMSKANDFWFDVFWEEDTYQGDGRDVWGEEPYRTSGYMEATIDENAIAQKAKESGIEGKLNELFS